MPDKDFATRVRELRNLFEDFGRIIDEHGGEGGFVPSKDVVFWRDLDRIEEAGLMRNGSEAPWLASLTQVDNLGPDGRALFLATAALAALRQMPAATFTEGKRLFANLPATASVYRKVGVCKVLEASACAEAIALIVAITKDSSQYVQREAEDSLDLLRTEVEQAG